MTQTDGGVQNSDVKTTAEQDTNAKTNPENGGENDVQKQLNELNAKYDTLLKESKGKDSKISQLLKEKETQSLASKTAEEQLEYYRNQTAQFERREAFRTSFKEVGLNPDDFMQIVDEKDPAVQAGKFAALLKAQTEESAKQAVEKFKKETLSTVGGEAKTTNKVLTQGKDAEKNNFLRGIADFN